MSYYRSMYGINICNADLNYCLLRDKPLCLTPDQHVQVNWINIVSSSFCVSNGVKQGGILSPTLFNVYMDSLSTSLNSTNIGEHIGGQLLNHLCYADDLCLISMSSAGMQRLLNIYKDYAEQHSLHYNGRKSFSMCFKSKTIKFERPDLSLGDLKIPLVSECKYFGITISEKKL